MKGFTPPSRKISCPKFGSTMGGRYQKDPCDVDLRKGLLHSEARDRKQELITETHLRKRTTTVSAVQYNSGERTGGATGREGTLKALEGECGEVAAWKRQPSCRAGVTSAEQGMGRKGEHQ